MISHLVFLSSSITEYFQHLKQIATTLAVAGQSLKDFEFTSYLLAGLGPKYDQFVTFVTTRVDLLTTGDLFDHLLTHEMRLER